MTSLRVRFPGGSALVLTAFITAALVGAPSAAEEAPVAFADFNRDFQVDYTDFREFVSAYQTPQGKYDLDGDGVVSFPDFLQFARYYGRDVPVGDDLNLILSYGSYGRNELNTFAGTVTKDMVVDPSITIRLQLTQAEMDTIHSRMVQIDFFAYPDTLGYAAADHPVAYDFRVARNDILKRVLWVYEGADETPGGSMAHSLRSLGKMIRGIVESKEEYKRLPSPRGAYL